MMIRAVIVIAGITSAFTFGLAAHYKSEASPKITLEQPVQIQPALELLRNNFRVGKASMWQRCVIFNPQTLLCIWDGAQI